MKLSKRARVKERALRVCNVLFKQRKLLFFVFFLFFFIIVLLNISSPHKFLVIEEAKTGKVLWKSEISAEDWFHHEYIHSVEKSLVIEKFKIDQTGQIFAMESWTRSFGAGLPYELKGTVEIADGYYISKELYEPIDVLHMQPSHLHLHTFHLRGDVVVLSEAPFTRTHLKFYIKKLNWLEFIFWT
ncbi:DUF1850 domain-containing protein [Anaerobacillus isosaccharinicus]|uniref:DUF1850 domain-containing protein n=1 Tax=Anaerobacillus isosaccharinicus TaxID=1532552 RepID=A0A1S2LC37_9BACI|nr:DUF1850 domain-containing protein [Anaerobacillus isosaccharinicus]MBA5584892.1 DUF1850 domain-containing protein [Anaerobacillus isosaccharinicus]QOY36747.1 DUF1850 domain-containing protein [Anaerobacillus isosaccharinicus]